MTDRNPRRRHCFLPTICLFLLAPLVAHAQLRDDVLIVVNDNSVDSVQVGTYYATQRGIDPANICHVRVPAGYFMSWDEFRSLRDQIIDFMQQNTIGGQTPVACTDGDPPHYCTDSADQLRQNTSIRYLVTTRGVPTRMPVDGSSLWFPTAPTSVDNYLKYWLVRYFSQDVVLNFVQRRNAFADGRGMREVEPGFDGELIVSRLDGLTLAAANSLVDRAMRAEREGIYGKLYGSKYGSTGGAAQWFDYSTASFVYGDPTTSWQYQLGLVGEDRVECLDYLDQSAGSAAGKAPPQCLARMTSGDDPPPGRSASREPDPFNALFWLGSLDGQPTIGSFRDFRNWRRDNTCSVTLCKDAADPTACRAASSDVFREIDTSCMGVAEGFWGYNFQSFPVSYFTAWPTDWYHNSGSSFTSLGGGDTNRLAFPEIREDLGRTDSNSLWFRNADQIADPRCYDGSEFTQTPTRSCPDEERVMINQMTLIPQRAVNTPSPQQYRVGLHYKTEGIPSRTLRARFWVREVGGGSDAIDYGTMNLATLSGDQDWTYAEVVFTLDPALHLHPERLYDGIRVRIETSSQHSGALGVDDVTIQEVGDPVELATNRSFSEGHEQVSAGDHAANFLSRLNGTAFFGSLSHHESGGHSFEKHPEETLLYFLRGLPLGDAVWWAENHNSGVLYGDPLYSPTAIRFDYLNDQDRAIDSLTELFGSTLNGSGAIEVETLFEVDYCAGNDFFVCDQSVSWIPTNLFGAGGFENQSLGEWDTDGIPYGLYTLRLKVTSSHLPTGRSQSFYDYYPVTVGFPLPEVSNLRVEGKQPNRVFWDGQALVVYDLVGGGVRDLGVDAGFASAECLFDNLVQTEFFDQRPAPPAGEGYYYLVRAQGAGTGSYGDGKLNGGDPRNELDLSGPCP